MIVYFVRHAQPDYSSVSDDYSFGLSGEGIMDRYAAADILKDVSFDKIYCSPYKRAVQTIQPIADYCGMEIITDERLRERVHGENSNNTEMFRRRWEDHSFHEPGGESIADVQKRYLSVMEEIIKANSYGTVLVGTHGTAICSFINHFIPEFGFDDFMRTIDYMPWVIKIEFSGMKLYKMEELGFVQKEFHGVK